MTRPKVELDQLYIELELEERSKVGQMSTLSEWNPGYDKRRNKVHWEGLDGFMFVVRQMINQ